jgi:hypothetical protein
MGAGPSRIPYDPGAFAFGSQGPASHYPGLDRAFDSGNYHGMTSPPSTSTNPSLNIMTPNYQLSNSNSNASQQQLRSSDGFAGMSNTGSSNQGQQFQPPPNHHPHYPYNPSVAQAQQGESWSGRRHSGGLNQAPDKWDGQDYGQMGGQSGPDFRQFVPASPGSTNYAYPLFC